MIFNNIIHERAVFIGEDGSMGLTKFQKYNVSIQTGSRFIIVDWGTGYCPYSTMKALLKNWKFLGM